MKRLNLLVNTAIILLMAGIIALIVFKYALPSRKSKIEVGFKDYNNISVLDLMGNQIKLPDIMAKDETVYCLVYDLNNCYTCIYKGIEDMRSLKKAGKKTMILVLNDFVDTVRGHAGLYDYSPFFALRKTEFYEHFQIPLLPAVIQVKNGKILKGIFITP